MRAPVAVRDEVDFDLIMQAQQEPPLHKRRRWSATLTPVQKVATLIIQVLQALALERQAVEAVEDDDSQLPDAFVV